MRRTTLAALLLLAAPAIAAAQQPQERPPRSVTVSANASVHRAPDRAIVMLAVESEAESAQDAGRQNAERMTQVIAALRSAGVPDARIRTVSYNLQPVYSQPPREPRTEEWQQRIVGYRAINMVRVEVDDVQRTGGVIDAALNAGANRVAGTSFELRDSDAAYNEALQQAVRKAQAQAAAAAQAAGQQLGQPLSIQAGGFAPPPMPMYRAAAASMDAMAVSTPVEGGELEISASVTITYELIGG